MPGWLRRVMSRLKSTRAISKAEDELGDNQADLEKSIAYFEETIKKDPTFAPAYVGLAIAYPRGWDQLRRRLPPRKRVQK